MLVPIHNKYENRCSECGAITQKGELVLWDRTTHKIKHIKCNPTREAYSHKKGIALRFEKNNYLIGKIKQIGKSKWLPSEQIWLASPTHIQATDFLDFLVENNFKIEENIQSNLIKLQEIALLNLVQSQATKTQFIPNHLLRNSYEFQNVATELGINNKRIIIGDEMGVGKTQEAIGVLSHLQLEPFVVVCPAVAKETWQDEIQATTNFKVDILDGQKSSILPHGNFILNFDILPYWLNALNALGIRALIIDEAHYIRNHKTKRARAILELSKSIEYILALTGTLIINGPLELITLLRVLRSFEDFGGFKYFIDQYREPTTQKMLDLNRKLRYSGIYIRRNIEDVATFLPDKPIRQRIHVDISNQTEYTRAETELAKYLADQRISSEEFLNTIDVDLPQDEWQDHIEQEYKKTKKKGDTFEQLLKWNALGLLAAQGKMESIIEWINNFLLSKEKLTIFAYYRDIQNQLLKEFPNALHVLAADTASQRQSAIHEFQTGENPLVICSLKAANVNITLTRGHYSIFTDLGWTPADHAQAEARQHRLGQKYRVWCGYFVGKNTIDEERFNIIDDKEPIVDAVIQGVLSRNG